MRIRIQLSHATVKALYSCLQQAYRRDDGRLVRRTTVLVDLLVHHVPLVVVCERWGLSPACLTEHLFLIHDGVRYHTSKATEPFFAAHAERITGPPLPSYSPDDNPIAYLWHKTKKRATHNQYFKACAALTVSVDKTLAYFATHPDPV